MQLEIIDVVGDYWHQTRAERTELGALMHAAKDNGDRGAANDIAARVAEWAFALEVHNDAVVVAVPSSPDRSGQVVSSIASAVASRLGLEFVPGALTRATPTARLRDLDPHERAAVASAGGYQAHSAVARRNIVLVDDVIVTGTTLQHLAGLLLAAGASSVRAIVATRSRRQ